MLNKNTYQLLGLAMASKNLVTGDVVLNYIRSNKVALVIICEDASDNTKKKFSNKCEYYGIEYIIDGNSDDLSHAIGKDNRKVVGILNAKFAKKIIESSR